MENGRIPPGPARKPDEDSARRGIMVQFERSLLHRIDQVRNEQPRTAWIRQAIEDRLIEEQPRKVSAWPSRD